MCVRVCACVCARAFVCVCVCTCIVVPRKIFRLSFSIWWQFHPLWKALLENTGLIFALSPVISCLLWYLLTSMNLPTLFGSGGEDSGQQITCCVLSNVQRSEIQCENKTNGRALLLSHSPNAVKYQSGNQVLTTLLFFSSRSQVFWSISPGLFLSLSPSSRAHDVSSCWVKVNHSTTARGEYSFRQSSTCFCSYYVHLKN